MSLKGCPFCGSPAAIESQFGREWWAQCTKPECGKTDGCLYASAQEAIEQWNRSTPLSEQPAAPTEQKDHSYSYAVRLASHLWSKHYSEDAPLWTPLSDLPGVLTQIDNMLTGLSRAQVAQPAAPSGEQEAVAWEVSTRGTVQKIVRRDDVADEFADRLRRDGHSDVRVRPLYAHPPEGAQANLAPGLNDTKGEVAMLEQYCVVRTYSAGVHVGTVVAMAGKEVTLKDARRIWYWKGANTLHEIALHGVGVGSKVSEPVESILLTEAIEIIPATAAAQENLRAAKWVR